MDTTCFGQYGHLQVLKYVVGKLLLFIVLLVHVWSLRCGHMLCLVCRARHVFAHRTVNSSQLSCLYMFVLSRKNESIKKINRKLEQAFCLIT
jgi:hypothetical protein